MKISLFYSLVICIDFIPKYKIKKTYFAKIIYADTFSGCKKKKKKKKKKKSPQAFDSEQFLNFVWARRFDFTLSDDLWNSK